MQKYCQQVGLEKPWLIYLPILPVEENCVDLQTWKVYGQRLEGQRVELLDLLRDMFGLYYATTGNHYLTGVKPIPRPNIRMVEHLQQQLDKCEDDRQRLYNYCMKLYDSLSQYPETHNILQHLQINDQSQMTAAMVDQQTPEAYNLAITKAQEHRVYWQTRLMVLQSMLETIEKEISAVEEHSFETFRDA